VYKEPSRTDYSNKKSTTENGKKGQIFQKPTLTQTAIVEFDSTNSAIVCKEELHWRPIAVNGSHQIDEELLKLDARERPIVSVQFQSSAMRMKLKGSVRKNFDLSWMKIRKWRRGKDA